MLNSVALGVTRWEKTVWQIRKEKKAEEKQINYCVSKSRKLIIKARKFE